MTRHIRGHIESSSGDQEKSLRWSEYKVPGGVTHLVLTDDDPRIEVTAPNAEAARRMARTIRLSGLPAMLGMTGRIYDPQDHE